MKALLLAALLSSQVAPPSVRINVLFKQKKHTEVHSCSHECPILKIIQRNIARRSTMNKHEQSTHFAQVFTRPHTSPQGN